MNCETKYDHRIGIDYQKEKINLMIPIFFTNYHNAVNDGLVNDFGAIGCTVYMPDSNWGGKIGFFAPNDEHREKPFVKLVSHEEFLELPRLAMLIPCNQLIPDFYQLHGERKAHWEVGRGWEFNDRIIYLTAQSISDFAVDGTDFVLTHDIEYHRRTKAKFKMIYFSKPQIHLPPTATKDLRKSFDEKKIRLYINNFRGAGFEPEFEDAKRFRALWNRPMEFFGYDNENGYLSETQVQEHMIDSMFTLVFKRRETWGQTTNVSMLLGTPLIMLRKYMNNLLTQYEITEDNSILGDTIEELVARIEGISFEEYETISMAARTMARMFTADEPRRDQLAWLMQKVTIS